MKKKFCVLKEEMQVDIDSFDYIFYHYGMEMYGNMPLIEPQETKEVNRIEDFVIAIDTSMSCKRELVQKFFRRDLFRPQSVRIILPEIPRTYHPV